MGERAMTKDEWVRYQCVDLAARTSEHDTDKDEVVKKAKKFETFIKEGTI